MGVASPIAVNLDFSDGAGLALFVDYLTLDFLVTFFLYSS